MSQTTLPTVEDARHKLQETGGRLKPWRDNAERAYEVVRDMGNTRWQSADRAFLEFRARLTDPDPVVRTQIFMECEAFFHAIRIGAVSIGELREVEADIRHLGDGPKPKTPLTFAASPEADKLLSHLHSHRITVELVDGVLRVHPASRLNETARQQLRQHQADIELLLADVEYIVD